VTYPKKWRKEVEAEVVEEGEGVSSSTTSFSTLAIKYLSLDLSSLLPSLLIPLLSPKPSTSIRSTRTRRRGRRRRRRRKRDSFSLFIGLIRMTGSRSGWRKEEKEK